jgi:hypothetical protein
MSRLSASILRRAAKVQDGEYIHPALKKNGKFKRKAKTILRRPILDSRIEGVPVEDTYYGAQYDFDHDAPRVRNTELFYRIADLVEVFPESYDQDVWGAPRPAALCGTSHCIAGHAAAETGWMRAEEDWETVQRKNVGVAADISSIGALELGITDSEAEFIFGGCWAPDDGNVAKALRRLGDGADLSEVAEEWDEDDSPAVILVTGVHPSN